jgi:hypothetical protein
MRSNPDLESLGLYEELINTPEKFEEACVLLLEFANNQLDAIGLKLKSLKEFSSGAMFIILIGLTRRFFVPFNQYYTMPKNSTEKVFII